MQLVRRFLSLVVETSESKAGEMSFGKESADSSSSPDFPHSARQHPARPLAHSPNQRDLSLLPVPSQFAIHQRTNMGDFLGEKIILFGEN